MALLNPAMVNLTRSFSAPGIPAIPKQYVMTATIIFFDTQHKD
jgi:hypothetical protein